MYPDCRIRRQVGQHLNGLKEMGYTTRYIDQHRQTLAAFVRHCLENGIGSAGKVDAPTVISFCKKYEDYSGSYQQKHWVVLRKFLADQDNPCLLRVRPRVRCTARVNVSWLTREEAERIVSLEMNPREALLIFGCLGQLMRRVEVLRITMVDASHALQTNRLRVRGKHQKERKVPLSPEFREVLENYLPHLEPMQDHDRILPIQRTRSEDILQGFCKRHGIRRLKFHELRRTGAKLRRESGTRLEVLSKLLGHKSLDETQKYIEADWDDMLQAMSSFRLVPNRPKSLYPGKERA